MENLDLYAKIEPMIGFYEAYENLYGRYLKLLQKHPVQRVLDVGCGNGKLLQKLSRRYEAAGIDISAKMVEIARGKGLDARHMGLEELAETFDAVVAVADVLNYMRQRDLQTFLEGVAAHLEEEGIFMADINTWHGFAEVAAGSMNVDEEDRFLAIDAAFEEDVLQTDIVYFERQGDSFVKESAAIMQYYYSVDRIASLSPMKLIGMHDVSLFSMEESDKTILIFQKQ
ncbi:MAG TPA: class I SAM-dependent methyltransferase [Campylobacteraceae bacterium]|nr:class I SAM-dependent methyltransferase [Campylobacteraceae bacterium]